MAVNTDRPNKAGNDDSQKIHEKVNGTGCSKHSIVSRISSEYHFFYSCSVLTPTRFYYLLV